MAFKPASKLQSKLRMAIAGPSGSGKTPCSLTLATELSKLLNCKIAVIDTETGSASKYSDRFQFDVEELTKDQSPRKYIEAIAEAERQNYGVLVIDSLSHAWAGREGSLEKVDRISAQSKSRNSFEAWRHVTPDHNRLVAAILSCNMHVIATMRVKTEFVVERDEKTGKSIPRKIGLAPIMRDGIEYEFDVSGDLDASHYYYVTKTRCWSLADKVIEKPGAETAQELYTWLTAGAAPPPPTVDLERRLDEDESRRAYQEKVERDRAQGKQGKARQADQQQQRRQAPPAAASQKQQPAPQRVAWQCEKLLPEAELIKIFQEWQNLTKMPKQQVYANLIYPLGIQDHRALPATRIPDLIKQIAGSYQVLNIAPGVTFNIWRDRLLPRPPAEPHVEPVPGAVEAQDAATEAAEAAPADTEEVNPPGKGDAFEGPDEPAGGERPDETESVMF